MGDPENGGLVAFGLGGPEAFVEHPVRVRTEGEAVAGVVVAALGVLVDVTGLDKCGVVGFQAIAGQGAGEVVAEDDVGLEAGVAAFLLAGFELSGVLAEDRDFLGFRKREAELFEEHDLFPRGEVEGGKGEACGAAEGGVLQAGKEIGIELAEACGEFGVRGLPVPGKALPDLVAVAPQRMERHGDVRGVALAVSDAVPVAAKGGGQLDTERDPAVCDESALDEVDDTQEHDRLMRSETTCRRARDVQVRELAKPELLGGRHGEG